MAYKMRSLWLAAALIVPLAACNPASPPSDPTPVPVVPPTTPASASVAATVAVQAANPDLSPQGQPLEQPISCREELGDPAAKRLVERCIAVSPATRPPCNAANPCMMIQDEIKRGCDFFGPDEKPAECSA
ncbi:hypothetical protein [Brevundimonas sp.]|uniref:hypothetical protein n=1 Tax=Brevundimonas sp. TaxID=1871086 RepID=UPI002FC67986